MNDLHEIRVGLATHCWFGAAETSSTARALPAPFTEEIMKKPKVPVCTIPEVLTERFPGWMPTPCKIMRFMDKIQASSLHVYLALCFSRGELGVFPGVERLAMLCRCSRRTVFRALKELEDNGLVKRSQRPGRSTLYTLIGLELKLKSGDSNMSPPT